MGSQNLTKLNLYVYVVLAFGFYLAFKFMFFMAIEFSAEVDPEERMYASKGVRAAAGDSAG